MHEAHPEISGVARRLQPPNRLRSSQVAAEAAIERGEDGGILRGEDGLHGLPTLAYDHRPLHRGHA